MKYFVMMAQNIFLRQRSSVFLEASAQLKQGVLPYAETLENPFPNFTQTESPLLKRKSDARQGQDIFLCNSAKFQASKYDKHTR